MTTFIILPARLESSRLSKKLIQNIGDKALIEHMILCAKKIKDTSIIVSTDSKIIQKYADKHNVKSLLSSKKFKNGSERCYFTAKKFKASNKDIIINLQADEFNIDPNNIRKLIRVLKLSDDINVCTLIYETENKNEYLDSNFVKAVVDKQLRAITFTRKPITSVESKYLIHLGVYGYKFKTLEKYSSLKQCHYEKDESLEQLRMIWNNIPIHCVQVKDNKSIGINSVRDLKKARDIYEH
ncbi:MAG: 3-deoxy-manno-octulosonate cytidylyltransferase [Gammaproteobacteria bacterium]|jgi:3-deoxy-manno-octulosonate cytidylyltransferase (CMP-KDO synthetase)|tara:strand:- start:52 stop:771 length:720 start_codon:yes stop_codon:yes gene_type:complete